MYFNIRLGKKLSLIITSVEEKDSQPTSGSRMFVVIETVYLVFVPTL